MNRTPPIEVRRALRREVGFGCPVPGCGNPYLTWHHFDPPWNVTQHHNPAGMIALCVEHHPKADAGAFTDEQLREMKTATGRSAVQISGRFDWLRQKLLAVVGGQFHYEPAGGPVDIDGKTFVGIKRDADGYMLVDVHMPTITGEPRLVMEENCWLLLGEPDDFECPPSGRLIKANYANGDNLKIEFFDLATPVDASKRYTGMEIDDWSRSGIEFPITSVEVTGAVGGTNLRFDANRTTMGPNVLLEKVIFRQCYGINFGLPRRSTLSLGISTALVEPIVVGEPIGVMIEIINNGALPLTVRETEGRCMFKTANVDTASVVRDFDENPMPVPDTADLQPGDRMRLRWRGLPPLTDRGLQALQSGELVMCVVGKVAYAGDGQSRVFRYLFWYDVAKNRLVMGQDEWNGTK